MTKMSRMTPSSKYPVRNHPRPPSMTSRMGGSWHTYIHARELKFGTQVKNYISWQSMISRRTPTSKNPVRNLQRPSSMTSRMWGSWHTSNHARELKFGTHVRITCHEDLWCQEWHHLPSIQSITFNVLQVWLQGCGVLDTLLIMLQGRNLARN